jgi:hypothetical protein
MVGAGELGKPESIDDSSPTLLNTPPARDFGRSLEGAVCKQGDARGAWTALHVDQFQPLHLVEVKLERGLGKPRPLRDLLLRGVAAPALVGFAGHRAGDVLDVPVQRGIGVGVDEIGDLRIMRGLGVRLRMQGLEVLKRELHALDGTFSEGSYDGGGRIGDGLLHRLERGGEDGLRRV